MMITTIAQALARVRLSFCAFVLYGNIFPSTVNIWNTLPAATLDQPNIAKFKDELDRFY